jgi:hypothetical protein
MTDKRNDDIRGEVIGVLENVIALLRTGNHDEIRASCLGYSPAGDGMGCDNMFIDFSDVVKIYGKDYVDIGQVLAFLEEKK